MTTSEMTYAVLSFCARNPTTTVEEICAAHPQVGHGLVTEFVGEMAEARLLRATAQRNDLLDGSFWIISDIRGLTILGQEWLDGFSPVEDDSGFLH